MFSALGIKRIAKWSGPILALAVLLFADLNPERPETTRMAAVALWMVIWWLTEAVPLAVTALLPIALLPLLSIVPGGDVTPQYMNSIIFLFLGGFMVALAMEKWQLHRRIALRLVSLLGSKQNTLLLGFMIATAFLSMWISNTATTMMMVPIALGTIAHLEDRQTPDSKVGVALMLGIAYSASMGGIATLIGTPPNLVLTRVYTLTFPGHGEIGFATWMTMALPISVVLLTLTWMGLSWWGGFRNREQPLSGVTSGMNCKHLVPCRGKKRLSWHIFVSWPCCG